ncbi:hypothetical protein A0128_11925 [Leptospira tipperaryensis]|uniref:DUF2029 domain-containing protein n=1 Tax=Leptospira tipperaryensis TaxID=2564040 RepID=A0A1D7UY23_9LEPT|nr:glycosyltransferase 87 family protein [Leptospira tipperaryensis]AOP34493.1 hypothetical protein A0128_11925 [Leptospira tipperaryensis]
MIKRQLLFFNGTSSYFTGPISCFLYLILFLFWKSTPGVAGLILYLTAYLILFGIALLPLRKVNEEVEEKNEWSRIWFWGILFRLTALFTFPVWEDDWARFLWDGYQTLETGTPYGKPPSSFFSAPNLPVWSVEILSRINHPEVPTIYGPILQILFCISAFLFPGSLLGLKCFYFLIEIFGWKILQKNFTQNEFRILFWFPLLIIETYIQAHPDFLGLVLLCGVYFYNERKKFWIAGVLLGIACGVKTFAWILLPFCLIRTKRISFLIGFVSAFLLPYLYFWTQGGVGGDGLSIFLESWEFNSSLYAFLKWIVGSLIRVPVWSVGIFCLGIWGAIGLYCLRRFCRGDDRALGECFLWFFLLSPVVNPWYLLWPLFLWIRIPILPGLVFSGVVVLSYVSGKTLSSAAQLQLYENPVWILLLEYSLVGISFLFQNFLQKE